MQAAYVDHMGTDLSIVNAARVSFSNKSDWVQRPYKEDSDDLETTNEEFPLWIDYDGYPRAFLEDGRELSGAMLKRSDENLINFLARGMSSKDWQANIAAIECGEVDIEETLVKLIDMATHWTPFTHTAISLRMSAPVPIRTQCFKHKIGFTENEESRRYIKSTPELYVPDVFRLQSGSVKQGSSGVHPQSDKWRDAYIFKAYEAIALYEEMVADEVGVEQARFILPQGCEVNWIWTGNLAAFARYYNQRIDSHAQKESQELAKLVREIIEPLYPVSWKALTKGK
jgi:thymidylate synthase (FAD)